jgi:hypothetical protein
LNFLLDENFAPSIAKALVALSHDDVNFHHAVDEFGRGASDTLVFEGVRDRGWLLVTQDVHMARRPDQRQALLDAGLGVFVFTGRAQRSFRQIAVAVLSVADEMVRVARRTPRPFIWGIPDRGAFKRLDR